LTPSETKRQFYNKKVTSLTKLKETEAVLENKHSNKKGAAHYYLAKSTASGKSNGVLFVSANADKKKIRKRGNNGTTNHILSCASIIVIIFSEPITIITVKTAELKISS
jgi:hypothetical protein